MRPHGIIDVISYARLRRKTYWEKHPCYLGKVAFVLKSKPLIGFTSTGFEVSGVLHRAPAFFTHFHWYDGEVKTATRQQVIDAFDMLLTPLDEIFEIVTALARVRMAPNASIPGSESEPPSARYELAGDALDELMPHCKRLYSRAMEFAYYLDNFHALEADGLLPTWEYYKYPQATDDLCADPFPNLRESEWPNQWTRMQDNICSKDSSLRSIPARLFEVTEKLISGKFNVLDKSAENALERCRAVYDELKGQSSVVCTDICSLQEKRQLFKDILGIPAITFPSLI